MISNRIGRGYVLRAGVAILVIITLVYVIGTGDGAVNEIYPKLQGYPGGATYAVSNGYAYIGQSNNFSIFDIHNPSVPVEIGRVTISSNISNIRVKNNYAHIIDDKKRSVTIDISNPLAPIEIKRIGSIPSTTQQLSWPIDTGSVYMTAPVLADFDSGYEGLEIIVAAGSNIYIWHYDGMPMANWNPLVLGQIVSTHSPPAIGDLDRDGYPDMVVTTYANNTEPAKVWVFNHNGSILPNWPKVVGGDITSAPVLADLDNDGFLEILVSSKDGNLYIWRYDGSNLNAAWPIQTNRTLYYSPVVGDLDNDKGMEIVLATGEGGSKSDYVYIWNINGSTLNSNWPKTLDYGYFGLTPSLGDINSDYKMEIVLGAGHDVDYGRVYAWNVNGSSVGDNWPKSVSGYAFFTPIGDIDPKYPGLEIISSISSDNKIYAWHSDGSNVSGWPYVLGGEGGNSPAIGDIDGDGGLEIIDGSSDSKMYVIKSNGSNQSGWPKSTTGILQTSPAIGDIDKDGKTEIIQPAGSRVYMWKEAGIGIMAWPMLQLDERHNGLYINMTPPLIRANLFPFTEHRSITQSRSDTLQGLLDSIL